MDSEAAETLIEFLNYFNYFSGEIGWQTAWAIGRDAILYGALGWGAAWWWERRHLRQLVAREALVSDITLSAGPKALEDSPIGNSARIMTSDFLMGSIVLSHDVFRSITIFFARLFGGNISHYERLLETARREAIVRLREEAVGLGIKKVINVKIAATSIRKSGVKTVEVLAYGTGVYEAG
jgi:uncharacterized protein YbjQ (UPF0145 family)